MGKNKLDDLEKKIQKLALDIDKVEDEKLEITNQLKKALADYQNLEKNTSKRLSLLYFQSRKELAIQLIPVIDDLNMAIQSKESLQLDEKSASWSNGIVEILNNLEKSMSTIGIKKFIPQKGEVFNPSIHEAISTIPGDKENTVFDVVQPGYYIDDIVVRPSRVVVIKIK